jgi:lantibiotic modifying enzyme
LFQDYPVLARVLGTTVALWVETYTEFLRRLAADLPELQRRFNAGEELGQVVTLSPGLSDPHGGRRTVCALVFASGTRLVYKPKDLGIEEAWARLLTWLNDRGSPLPFKVVTVLNRSTHGWVEFVQNLPCDDVGGAHRYFRRVGMLLCLAYALEVTDCHMENITACGDYPVMVDGDVLHHRARLEDRDELEIPAAGG